MKTYQDLLLALDSERSLADFLKSAIVDYKLSKQYLTVLEAMQYYKNENPTITKYQKLLYTISGKAVPDNYSADFRLASNVYFRFITQTVQYLLGNGADFDKSDTKERLGGKSFDSALQNALTKSLNGGAAYGFMNLNHLEVFGAEEFIPLYDEETGRLEAGIRFWQLESSRPLRVTLYESSGYTEFIQRGMGVLEVLRPKRAYKVSVISNDVGQSRVIGESNYGVLPIFALYSPRKQSSIVGLKRLIDCHDLIESGFANDIDDASMIYWTISNAGGMDDIDLAKFVEHMKKVKAAVVEDDGAKAESHTVDVPYQSREAILSRLEGEMYRDFMVLNPDMISGRSSTATAIKAAYEPMNLYSNMIEYSVNEFIDKILKLLDIDDSPKFKRISIANELENARARQINVETILQLRGVFDNETVVDLLADAMGLGRSEVKRVMQTNGINS